MSRMKDKTCERRLRNHAGLNSRRGIRDCDWWLSPECRGRRFSAPTHREVAGDLGVFQIVDANGMNDVVVCGIDATAVS
jgi:hypothetical protein